jgi:hypothetical protein
VIHSRLVSLPTILTALLAAAACGAGKEEHEVIDAGRLCVSPPGAQDPIAAPAERFLPADQPLTVTVQLDGCLSSSCDIARSATCSVTRSGDVLQVKSTLAWTSTGDNACTEDCGFLVATCTSDPLSAGTYTVEHGDRSATIVVGGTNGPCPDLVH